MKKYSVIITAGGIGKRMESDIPKQFLLLQKKPILQYCLEAFYSFNEQIQIIVTLPTDWMDYWKELCEKHNCDVPHKLVDGGKERFHSIQNALAIADGNYIAVHDGVRPLVSKKIIENAFQSAEKYQTAIPVISLKDSLRKVELNNSSSCLRKDYVLVQTPQVFEAELLRKAYQQNFHAGITDDASLVEELGVEITLVDGGEENIKITSPFDLKIAEIYLQKD